MCDTNPMQNHYPTMGFAGEGLWGMGYDGLMGYGMQIPAYQLGGLTSLWGIRGYGLSMLWVKRGSTVLSHKLKFRKHKFFMSKSSYFPRFFAQRSIPGSSGGSRYGVSRNCPSSPPP